MVCPEIKRTTKDGEPWAAGDGFYLHPTLKENLDYEHKRIQKSWDCCAVITGEEGSGKSNLGKAVCYYMASLSNIKFTANDVVFTVEQFEKWLENAPPGAACLWDEFVLAGASQDALLPIQNILIKKMTLIRKRRLFIVLVIPYIFMLRKYFAVARTRFLLHVTSPDNMTRGTFDYYSKPNKRKLYILGFKFWEYNVWDCDFHGNFSDYSGLLIDEAEYERKKDEVTNTFDKKESAKNSKVATSFAMMCIRLMNAGMSQTTIAQLSEMKDSNIVAYITAFKEANPQFNADNDANKIKMIANECVRRQDYALGIKGSIPMPKYYARKS